MVSLLAIATGSAVGCKRTSPTTQPVSSALASATSTASGVPTGAPTGSSSNHAPLAEKENDDDLSMQPMFPMPTGQLPRLSCDDARAIVDQVLGKLPYLPQKPRGGDLVREATIWLDPHALWTEGNDSPIPNLLRRKGEALLTDLTFRPSLAPSPTVSTLGPTCASARTVAEGMPTWVSSLHDAFVRGQGKSAEETASLQALASRELPHEGSAVARAEQLGRIAKAARDRNQKVASYIETLEHRAYPKLSTEEWTEVLLASAVRAWVPLIDVHSSWAPPSETTSLYDIDLDDIVRGRIWKRAKPTLLGATIDELSASTATGEQRLVVGDVVLEVAGQTAAGMSAEELEELAVAPIVANLADTDVPIKVLRNGEILELQLHLAEAEHETLPEVGQLSFERIAFGGRSLALIRIEDVHDNLGQEMSRLVQEIRKTDAEGIVLDLRGNGGGSMDAALDALGHFLPGLPMCPLKDNVGQIAPDVSTTPNDRWEGPVLSLVNRETASAAEILAGSLGAYQRGLIVGTKTFGKGCVQEYIETAPRVGWLRITSFLYALPNGAPVQRVGLQVDAPFEFPTRSRESEASASNTGPSWRGNDVRPKPLVKYASWPRLHSSSGIGPCKDASVCKALQRINDVYCRTPNHCAEEEPVRGDARAKGGEHPKRKP
jgi:carboxyl-terminal processing protease